MRVSVWSDNFTATFVSFIVVVFPDIVGFRNKVTCYVYELEQLVCSVNVTRTCGSAYLYDISSNKPSRRAPNSQGPWK